ncbi:DEAD/DEAH box helicase [Butyrivibrio sp. MC2013]|uniref:DEAD/DEAH box helicase n=1 Tax=Butyrivibrio sp. MC2013 TaxID=1280686 RepID=UPI00040CABFB|nr:DEAD/DEAH box helicase [Butyrivibrio sp. MC2013]
MNVFDRYAPFIQDFIYENSWESLRAIQVAAGDAIFNTDDNLLLCASTASGKTEAAFFPILTLLSEDPPASVGAIYIGPLKALINDQFSRLTDLCDRAQIPVWHWHGDVNQSHKNKLLKSPSGILQITPESLEALMLHKHGDIARLFGDLRFIVIDEVHSLMRGDRGGQTLCLIERLCRMAGASPRRIGLSATIGDLESTGRFLSSGSGRGCVIPKIDIKGQTWRLSMEHFYIQGPQAGEAPGKSKRAVEMEEGGDIIDGVIQSPPTEDASPLPVLAPATDKAPKSADPGMGYIFEHTRDKKCLVFCNSREEAEAVTTTLRGYCEARKEKDRFLIHHGNLSASYRQTAEEEMKDEDSYLTTVTTATLELGIDIGRLERAFQIDAPFTVSSFLQRMGRTGRRELPPEMWFVFREDEPEARAMLPETVPWKLIQGIALVQVYLEERWVEPPALDRLPYSLLYHQTMSTLASGGEMTPAELAARILSLSYFHRISQEDFKLLLLHLIDIDHIQKTENGGLIVGLSGERVINSYKFYAVFQENVEYTVRNDSQELGTIVAPPPIGEKIAIAGGTWLVEDVDHKRHNVYCTAVKGQVPAYFGQCPGDIHTHILERMKKVLEEDRTYPYLMQNALARLSQGRKACRAAAITDRPLVCLGGNMWALFPWLGSYSFLALERFLKIRCAPLLALKGMDSSRPYFMQFTMKASEQDFYEIVTEAADIPLDPMELLYPGEVPVFEKYDEIVPPDLVRKGFAMSVLGTDEMLKRVRSWKKYISHHALDAQTQYRLP